MRGVVICLSSLFFAALGVAASTEAVIQATKVFSRATEGKNGVVFLNISNTTDQAIVLKGAESPVSAHCELHHTTTKNGVSHMEHVEAITVPPHGRVQLKPGGLHIMLMNLKHPLKEKETLPLKLIFDNQQEINLTVPIKSAGATDCGCKKQDLCE